MTDLPQAVSQPSLHKSKSETVLSNKRLKEIIYNPDNGLLYLINPTGESFECNLYGHRNTKFKPNFSGMSTYDERVKNKSIKPLDHKMNSTFYHPQGKYFEGYFQFPNPLSRPFQNLDSDSTKLVDELKKSKRFALERNKHLLTLKTNEGLHYLTSSVLVNDEKGKMKLIELIDATAKEFYYNKELGKPLEYTEAQIRAIKKLKKILLMNNSNKIYKRIMPKPNMKAYEDYYTMHRAISVRPIEKLKAKHKKKVANLSMDYIIKSKNEKYEDNDLYYLSSKNNKDDFGKEQVAHAKKLISEQERIAIELSKKPIVKERGIFRKGNPKLKSRGYFYQKEIALMKKVNPIAFKKEEKTYIMDKVFFEKKKAKQLLQMRQFQMTATKTKSTH